MPKLDPKTGLFIDESPTPELVKSDSPPSNESIEKKDEDTFIVPEVPDSSPPNKPIKSKTEVLPDEIRESYKVNEDIHKQIGDILRKYNGMESNIPVNDPYWVLKQSLRQVKP